MFTSRSLRLFFAPLFGIRVYATHLNHLDITLMNSATPVLVIILLRLAAAVTGSRNLHSEVGVSFFILKLKNLSLKQKNFSFLNEEILVAQGVVQAMHQTCAPLH